MTIKHSRARLATDPSALTRMEHLLPRFPDITDSEREEIALYLRTASVMDVGLLSANQDAWTKAERFRVDHPAFFRATPKEYLGWAFFALVVVLTVFLLWDVGVGK